MAVARAMSEQTKEVPRSVVLVFPQNKVIVDHEDVDRDSQSPSTSKLWARKRQRASMSICVPGSAPGQVTPPPPPPLSTTLGCDTEDAYGTSVLPTVSTFF